MGEVEVHVGRVTSYDAIKGLAMAEVGDGLVEFKSSIYQNKQPKSSPLVGACVDVVYINGTMTAVREW